MTNTMQLIEQHALFVLHFEKKVFHLVFFLSKPKSDKVLQQTNKTKTKNKRSFFLPKINKVFLSPILNTLKGSPFGQIFYENDPLDEPKMMTPCKQKVLSFQEVGQK